MEAESLSMLLVGHSVIRRLVNYTIVSGKMNLGLEESDCQDSVLGRGGGFTLSHLMLSDAVDG